MAQYGDYARFDARNILERRDPLQVVAGRCSRLRLGDHVPEQHWVQRDAEWPPSQNTTGRKQQPHTGNKGSLINLRPMLSLGGRHGPRHRALRLRAIKIGNRINMPKNKMLWVREIKKLSNTPRKWETPSLG